MMTIQKKDVRMKVKMMKDMVLLREVKAPQKTSPSGLVLVEDKPNERAKYGDTVSVGPDVTGIRVGDRVLFTQRPGQEIGEIFEPGETSLSHDDRGNYWALHEDEVDAIVEQ